MIVCHIPGSMQATEDASHLPARHSPRGLCREEIPTMADFVQKTVNKTAVRDLAVPIATVTSFNTLIERCV